MASTLFSMISRQRLETLLSSLASFSGLSVRLMDPDGSELLNICPESPFCRMMKEKTTLSASCRSCHLKAGRLANDTGEGYIYTCSGDLNHLAFSLSLSNRMLGIILIGPFLMDDPDPVFFSGIISKEHLSSSDVLLLYDHLSKLPQISPAKVNSLKKITEDLVSSLFQSERAVLMESQHRLDQQARINETIRLYKEPSEDKESHSLFQLENQLLESLSESAEASRRNLDLLLASLYAGGQHPEEFRLAASDLLTLLSRYSITHGLTEPIAEELRLSYLSRLRTLQDPGSLAYLMEEMLTAFTQDISRTGDDLHIRKALSYIASHYQEPLRLQDAAEAAGLTPVHFSARFHEVMGICFRDYLAEKRVEESKKLLLYTDYPLSEIAAAMGFTDQSYYCRVFRKITGLTPGKYRNLN